MKRPLLWSLLFYIMGILCSKYMANIFMTILFTFLIIVLNFILYKKFKWTKVVFFLILYFIGYVNFYVHNKPVNELLEKHTNSDLYVTIEGRINDIGSIKDGQAKVIILAKHIYNQNINIKSQIKLQGYIKNGLNIKPGDNVLIKGNVFKPQIPTNPGQFNEKLYLKNKGIEYKFYGKMISCKHANSFCLKSLLYDLKMKICNKYDLLLPEKQSGIVKTMLLGYKSDLDQDVKKLFQEAGIAHILAISGLHVSIIAAILFFFLSKINISKRFSAILTIAFLVVYCMLTGSSISTIRATLMTSVVLFSYILYRTPDIYTSIGFSAYILLLIQPLSLWDIGFQLSYSAVIGLVLITPLFDKLYFIPKKIRTIFAASIAASLSTIPITLFHFYQFPTYSFLLNIIVVPLVTLVVLFSIIGGIISFFSLLIGKLFIGIVYYILILYEFICELTLKIPYSTLVLGKPNLLLLLCYYIIILTLVLVCNKRQFNEKKKIKDLLMYEVLLSLAIFVFTSNHMLEVNILDVGQGDGIVIHTKKGHTIIVDGGGEGSKYPYQNNTGYNIVYPYLKYKGVDTIDFMFLTHPHGDHIIGLIELLDLVKVKKIYVVDAKIEDTQLYNDFMKKIINLNIPVYKISRGMEVNIDSLKISCLWPEKADSFTNLNNSSMVLGLDYGNVNTLLTGDIEKETELELNEDLTHYEILKIPHHGSNTSSTKEFLSKVKPFIGLISCGEKSIYGHPHEKVVQRLEKQKINVYNTSVDGAIMLKTDGKKITVKGFLN